MPSPQGPGEQIKEHSRIVVGVDGSEESFRALDWAVGEAQVRDSELNILHAYLFRTVVEDKTPQPFRKDRDVLEEALERAAKLAPEIRTVGTLTEPPARDALVAASLVVSRFSAR